MIALTFASVCAAAYYYRLARSLQVCPVFGCLTRQGIERRKPGKGSIVVFMDIDDMKGANSAYGYDEVNRRIAASLSQVRQSDIVGRWFSGDEFVVFANGDETAIAARIKEAFKTNGLSVTLAYSKANPKQPLDRQVSALSDRVMAEKLSRKVVAN
jgi:GGDEF domain-containing protein